MNLEMQKIPRKIFPVFAAILLTMSGCKTVEIAGGVLGAVALGSIKSSAINQVYYLGVFDPQEQLPPVIYRVRVSGDASFASQIRFGSGWVRADLIDSLGTGIEFNKGSGSIEITKSGTDPLAGIRTGRRLMMFGPEGFREAPKDHRLVIVMGSSPEEFFNAIDQSIGIVSEAQVNLQGTSLNNKLFKELVKLKSERDMIARLEKDVEADLGGTVEVAQ